MSHQATRQFGYFFTLFCRLPVLKLKKKLKLLILRNRGDLSQDKAQKAVYLWHNVAPLNKHI